MSVNSDSSDEEDTVPLSNFCRRPAQERGGYRWRKKEFVPQTTPFTGLEQQYENIDIDTPLNYFKRFVTDDMIDEIVQHTNLYSVQKSGRSINTTRKELEKMLGMYFHMGLVQMNSVRQYWENETYYEPVSGVMSRNRFTLLLRSLHFVDNMAVTEEEKKDRVWKLRPFLTAFRDRCLLLTPDEHSSIDEMMCKFRGKTSPIRQYIKGKPHPWGFKIWGRAGTDGVLNDFDVYQGGNGIRTELGQGPDVVLKLTSTMAKNCRYKIYADNLFTSVPLLIKLKEQGMEYTGTVRKNRLPGCALEDEKAMKKRGRGAFDHRVEETHNIAAVRWFDNRAVSLLSTRTAVEPVTEATRWNKITKSTVELPMPAVVKDYNEHMGGIDLLDQFLSAFRFKMRSRRWYLYLFWHFVMVGIVNAWNVYRKEYAALGLPVKEMLSRRQFQVTHCSHIARKLVTLMALVPN